MIFSSGVNVILLNQFKYLGLVIFLLLFFSCSKNDSTYRDFNVLNGNIYIVNSNKELDTWHIIELQCVNACDSLTMEKSFYNFRIIKFVGNDLIIINSPKDPPGDINLQEIYNYPTNKYIFSNGKLVSMLNLTGGEVKKRIIIERVSSNFNEEYFNSLKEKFMPNSIRSINRKLNKKWIPSIPANNE